MKIFISQGLKNKTQEQIEYERNSIMRYISNIYPYAEFNKLLPISYVKTHTNVECLGCSIAELGRSDILFVPNDYMDYTGCIVEHFVAKTYGIDIVVYDIDDICYSTADDYMKFIKGGE